MNSDSQKKWILEHNLEASGTKMKKYLIVIEKSSTGYSAFCPDLPGCVAAARTRKSVEKLMGEAVSFHLETMKEGGLKIPRSQSYSTYLEVGAA